MTMREYTDKDIEKIVSDGLDGLLTITRDEGRKSIGESYRDRTIENARMSDFTIIFASDFDSPGTRLTMRHCEGKCSLIPFGPKGYTVDEARLAILKDLLKYHIDGNDIRINIAGNGMRALARAFTHGADTNYSESLEKDIQEMTDRYVRDVLQLLMEDGVGIRQIRSGGQTGIDMAGAKAGINLNIPTHLHMPVGYVTRDIFGKDTQHTLEQVKHLYRESLEKIGINRRLPFENGLGFSTFAPRAFQPNADYLGDIFMEYQKEHGRLPEFMNLESAFQYMKGVVSLMSGELRRDEEGLNERLMKQIWKEGGNGSVARGLGHELIMTDRQRKTWDTIKADVLKSLMVDSYTQNGDALSSLLMTGSCEFIDPRRPEGLDRMYPLILMEVRSELRQAVQAQSMTQEQWCCVSKNMSIEGGAAHEAVYNYMKPDGTLFSPNEWLHRTGPFVGNTAEIETLDGLKLTVSLRDGGQRCADMIKEARPSPEITLSRGTALRR